MQFYDYVFLVVTGLVWSGLLAAAEPTRQHEAHVHGAGTLNLVQEGQQLHLELDMPGIDIVGFEHQARTEAQKQAVKDAVSALQQGSAVFQINSEANCALDAAEVDVALLHEDHRDEQDREHKKEAAHHDHQDAHKGEKHAGHDAEREERHSEFNAKYVFTCTAPEKLRQLRVGLFETFKGSDSLQAQVITEHLQNAQRLTRGAPVIRLKP